MNNLEDLAHKINVCADKADNYRVTAAIHFAKAKEICIRDGIAFKEWVEANIKFSYDEARKLAVCGASGNPTKAIADMRAGSRARMAKSRAVQRDTAAEAPVPHDPADPWEPGVEDPAIILANVLDSIKDSKAVAEAYRKIFKVSSFDREATEQIVNAIKQLIVKWRTVENALIQKLTDGEAVA